MGVAKCLWQNGNRPFRLWSRVCRTSSLHLRKRRIPSFTAPICREAQSLDKRFDDLVVRDRFVGLRLLRAPAR
jgi:hypothetical protein